uniref:ATP-dependent DNA helicase PIF1 n=1 Tax=Plectus sambesii TaxID=2011161 RepID=A0A914W916_9BILA
MEEFNFYMRPTATPPPILQPKTYQQWNERDSLVTPAPPSTLQDGTSLRPIEIDASLMPTPAPPSTLQDGTSLRPIEIDALLTQTPPQRIRATPIVHTENRQTERHLPQPNYEENPAGEDVSIYKMNVRFFINQDFTCTRKQFPLLLAYAITCHKAQGLSLHTVFADIGEDVFQLGMAYVCLSRRRSGAAYIATMSTSVSDRPPSPSPLPPLAKCNILPASVDPLRRSLQPRPDHFVTEIDSLEHSWLKLKERLAARAPKQKKPQAAKAPKQKKPQAARAPKQKKPQASEAPKNSKVVLPAQKLQQQLLSTNPVPVNRPSLPSIVRLGNTSTINCYSNTIVQLFRHLPHFIATVLQAPQTDV